MGKQVVKKPANPRRKGAKKRPTVVNQPPPVKKRPKAAKN
jgi:hypothetical protein